MNKIKNYFMLWLIPLLTVLIMAGCEQRDGLTSPPITTTPTITSTNPENAAAEVPFNQQITATFSEDMNSSTITTATFTLMQGTSFVSGTVSYTGKIAAFAPTSNLSPNTVYTATITTMAKNLMGNALASNYIWSFTTGSAAAVTPPTVSSTDPVNGAAGVPINQKIAATFSVAMDATTITSSTFTLLQGTTPISGFVSYSGITAIFAPSTNLLPNTAYTGTITTGAKDLAGNALANNYVWSFTTGATAIVTPPIVSLTDPVNLDTNVPLNQKVAATFSKTMDATTITSGTFTLRQGTTSVSGFTSYSGTTAIFAPASNLAPNTVYTATITTGAKDLAGNALANNYEWTFTTGASVVITPPIVSSTDPANAEIGVALNQKIAATFSKTMDATTISNATFTLLQGNNSVTGFVSYSGTTATFAPENNLLPNSTYSAVITTGATDLAGNALENNYTWSFTTGSAVVITRPTVSLTDPLNNEINVPLNQKVAATFSKTMDATTITSGTYTLKQGTTSVSGFVSYSGTTAIFSPANDLAPNTVYTATVTTGAKDLAGNALANNYVWSFTTGSSTVITPPTVISTVPADADIDVPLNQKVTATFSKTMNASTITGATFTLTQGNNSVSGFVSYSGTTAIFAPASNLTPNTVYTGTITTEAKDLAGNSLANNYVWSFTTGSSPVIIPPTIVTTDPDDLEICVQLDKTITATFSKPMNASTITTAIFTIMRNNIFIAGTVSYMGNTATFNPSDSLLPNATYTATITTGARDLTGTPLEENYVWTFTTVVPYTVTLLSNPLDGGTTNGSGTFNSCDLITVTATPNDGYEFVNWTENGSEVSTNTTYEFTLDGNKILTANFAPIQYTVSLSSNPALGGTTTGSGTYDFGDLVSVTATPGVGFSFTNWTESGSPVSTNANYTFTITGNTTLVANFSGTVYTITATAGPNGSILPTGVVNVNYGANQSFTITPDATYDVDDVLVDGLSVGAVTAYTFTNVTANHTIAASFALTPPTGQLPVDLGTAARFAILSHSSITNDPTSAITGDVGVSPGSSLSGFVLTPDPSGEFFTDPQVNGGLPGIYTASNAIPTPDMLIQAKADAETAYLDATSATRGTPTSLSGNINGLTLVPGLYESGSSIEISPGGSVTLDAGGDANAVFIIRSASSITTEATSEVILAGSANPEFIYWVAGSTITLGTSSIMKGTLIASTSIMLLLNADLEGRALIQSAAAGSISLLQNTIYLP